MLRASTSHLVASACLGILACSGCSAEGLDTPPDGPLARQVRALSRAQGVPGDLVLAIAAVEGGLTMPAWRTPDTAQTVPVAGILELRHGAFDSLARGAALTSRPELELRADTDAGTEAGVLVLAELGRDQHASGDDLASWRDAVAQLSGLTGAALRDDYVTRVYRALRFGGRFPARDGETVSLVPHDELPASLFMGSPGLTPQATPDFPGAIWVDTPQSNKWTPGRPDGDAAVNTVVIHDTEGGWDASLATLQNDGGKSAHYLIDADGSRVAQFLSEYDTAWHAGNWFYNTRSVGIEHVGYVSDANGYSTALYDKSVELVQSIRSRWSVPVDRAHIVGHYQIPNGDSIAEGSPPCSAGLDACESNLDYGGASHHTDPGYHWQWCQYLEKLGGTCECNDAWSLWNCTNDGAEVWRCNNGVLEKQDCETCEVMPVGTPDVCHAAAGPEPEPEASTSEDASEEPAQTDAPVSEDAEMPAEAGLDSATVSPGAAGAASQPDGCACRAGRADAVPNARYAVLGLFLAMSLVGRRSRRRRF